MRSMSTRSTNLAGTESPGTPLIAKTSSTGTATSADLPGPSALDSTWNESDSEKNFKDHGKFSGFCFRILCGSRVKVLNERCT